MKVFLIDGNALLYRSHFAFQGRHLATSQGEVTSAAFGFTNSLLHLWQEEGAEAILVAFDVKGPTFRHEAYAQYKADRPPMPQDLVLQLDRVKQLVEAMGLPLLARPGVEADDVLGTLAATGTAQGHDMWIYSGDKDFIPLIRPGVSILKPAGRGGKDTALDERAATESIGVRPAQFLDVLTLMGDKVDNIPGVPGVGQKTATKLIAQFESLDRLMENLDDKRVSARHRRLLEEHRDQFSLARSLLTIRQDLELDFDWDALRPANPVTQEFLALCRELEFTQLLNRLGPVATAETEAPKATVNLVTDLASAKEAVADLQTKSVLSIDVLGSEDDPLRSTVVGVALGGDERTVFLVGPANADLDLFADSSGSHLTWAELGPVLAPLLGDPRVEKRGHDLKTQMLLLAAQGVPMAGAGLDIMIASHLLAAERRQHQLESLSADILGRPLPPLGSLFEGLDSKRVTDVPADRLGPWLASRVDAVGELAEVMASQMTAEEVESVWTDLERPLTQVLLRMEQRGIRLDVGHLTTLSKEFSDRVAAMVQSIHELAAEEFNLNSPKQLQRILFEKLGLTPLKKTSTGFSTDESVLTRLAEEHPLPRQLLEYRQLAKLLSTYVDALPGLVNPRTGCVHTSYSQAVAATGRLSSADPNLQNIPIRTDEGRRIREAFVPSEKGWSLLAADYSQIELRLMAHFSQDKELIGAFQRREDIHARTAALVNGLEIEAVTADLRRNAKAINFGILYGMGARALAQQLGVKQKEAQGFIQEYFDRLPRVRQFIDDTIAEAHVQGEVRTVLGRRRRLPELTSQDPRQKSFGERIAVNTPIQGSAADLIKLAMIRLDERIERESLPTRLLLQVHDELILEVDDSAADAVAEVVREEMEGVWELRVPLVVDRSLGKNWAEAHA